MTALKMGVIGIGHLGVHHARIVSSLPEVELIGICDINESQVRKIARQYKTTAYTDYRQLLSKVDAVSIAVPTPWHYQIAKDFINARVHCLIEKPITPDLPEAEELVDLVKQKNLILQVGHIERFNPAVLEAQKYINEPKFIEANRLGPYDPRVAHISVVLDLMIHDIDIVLYLVQDQILSIDAVGAKVLSHFEDIANARIRFAHGCVATISASRVSLKKFRKIRIFQKDSYLSLDYAKPGLKIYQKKKEDVTSLKDIKVVYPRLVKLEPLAEELKHFVNCVREGRKPQVTGEHGRDALEIALEIMRKIKQ
ncbi:MAG: Gfo/Idh/MocA family oxidoreductase [bacterium]|nr:Gfo/Idh/MocA family oxidoreductase [bacterium]MDD5354096.1 Gfo/Idh/MocA family oxidoreductase [bacterium]MDD5756362.1 Gfo/Idh/MocA family oxidoreductase [bacterium]